MLILVLPAFTPDGPEARLVSVTRDVKPLVIEVESAAWYEWALLDGIGEARARRIVDYVRRHPPLKSLEQLAEIPGLPRGWLTKARPFITLRREEAGR
jgi:DNA uptake protein ComE-like DNA-binding protein